MSRWRWSALAAALLLLDVSLTFDNLWPTPAIWWRGRLSIELAVFMLALVIAGRWVRWPSRSTLAGITVIWVVMVIGRYADVTAYALYGRDINLYWDLRFIPDVVSMAARVAPVWLIAATTGAVVLAITLLYFVLRWAIGRVARAAADADERLALACLAVAATLFFTAERAGWTSFRPAWDPAEPVFTTPVTTTYARQIRFLAHALAGSATLAASPAMDSDLSRIQGADVFIVFIESYGAVGDDRPEVAARLVSSRAQLDADIRDTRRGVVSAYVESPTFGGSSWLAHLSLMSGIEVRDPDTNAALMASHRDTLARAFARRGFRTIALLPGMRRNWPEGSFYGFDEIYSADRLAYHGPEFGWFAIPDQFALARLDALEAGKTSRAPLFVFFPTISTHFPFSPTPPYQPDWPRILTGRPYDGDDLVHAYAREPDWIDFRPGYSDAIAYDFATIGGYLRLRHDRDIVMVLLGDHQPPAVVSGAGARWDVPVHVVANRTAVLDRLTSLGFRKGLKPEGSAIGKMHTLTPILLAAFGAQD